MPADRCPAHDLPLLPIHGEPGRSCMVGCYRGPGAVRQVTVREGARSAVKAKGESDDGNGTDLLSGAHYRDGARDVLRDATAGLGSELEERFAALWTGPAPVRQYRPLPGRRYRCDFCWPDRRLAVEVQGMVHRIRGRFAGDVERRNALTAAGWRVFEATGAMLRDPAAAARFVALVNRALGEEEGDGR